MESFRKEINDYVSKNEEAIKNIKLIIEKLAELSSSFNNASGLDIERIRNDIDSIKESLTVANNTIKTAKDSTISRAESCDRCYNKYKNKSYPAYETKDRKYFSGANVYIDENGIINVSREYVKKLGLIESLFMSHAGEYYDDTKIGLDEMFNS